MKATYQERQSNYLKAILAELPRNATAMQQAFTEQFYAKMPLADLERIEPPVALQIALCAFAFMEWRTPGQPKIRVFSPNAKEHGYESRRLVVELLNDDMPFLVDSLSGELIRLGFTIHQTIHPIFRVSRERKGQLQEVSSGEKASKKSAESLIHFELSLLPAGITAESLEESLNHVLAYIRAAVGDWKIMTERVRATEDSLQKARKAEPEEIKEAQAFLRWMHDRKFVFLGYSDGREKLGICSVDDSLLMKPEKTSLISISKSDRKSPVHRPGLMDIVTVQAGDGSVRQFIGLFTSIVYYQSVEDIPLIRSKLAHVVKSSGLEPVSHDGKALQTILEFLPRDEIFQSSEYDLLDIGMSLLALEAKPGVRLFARKDEHQRFVTCMVYVPREYFSTALRVSIIDMLTKAYGGQAENFYTQMTESPLARLYVVIRTAQGFVQEVDVSALESDIARFTHLWSDELHSALISRFGEHEAESVFRAFGNAFPAGYVSRYNIEATVFDIEKSMEALKENTLTVDLYRVKSESGALHLKIYNPSEEIALSDIIPMLENMGFRAIDEHPFLITPHRADEKAVWIRDFKLTLPDMQGVTLEHVKPLFEEALLKVWRGEMENDRFNRLVIGASLSWRQVTVLRAYARYLRQIGFPYAQPTIEQAMFAHLPIASNLAALFMVRFDPKAADADAKQRYLTGQIEQELAEVSSLADDRILRQYLQLMQATLRTNFYQIDENGAEKPVLSFKLKSADVPGMPKPVPFAEIFVYSTRVEGIHLRGGKVARGGIRWSDRHDDFRTEILGLMKAQMVKNAVIVPVGSKGGFVVRRPTATREAFQAEGVACYRQYLSGLLDVTDNIADAKVVPPARVKRYDADDPYLVVAADKGTATFSDIANEVSQAYGFWLDDAFASGGSAGYDHKKMGITARGGWVSVMRHFREMGVDMATQEYTAVGIGDMSGDVFGNGMLLSDTMKLVAAFNHIHIFIDPTPDAKASFEERKRLFALPRSTWKDYDAKKISKGGGVFERSAKTIAISKEAKQALSIDKDSLSPDELIRAILAAPVDLLWNGGIGTYVKAEEETHEQVGDRTNNGVRVNGRELRCKVVGEGGNLGFTQKGRIEYARTGGRINTDAIDNSGGVDCSDHEVNIKIAFSEALRSNRLTRDKRNVLLAKMTDDVATLVLKDNILQTQAISLAEAQGPAQLESQVRLMQHLEKQGLLDRMIEYLPADRQLSELQAAGKGLTRPELSVLLAYSKIALYHEIMDSGLADEPYFAIDLMRYFPKGMQKDYEAEIAAHPLKRDIIGTVMTNSIVNRVGITFFFDMLEDTGLPPREVAVAYAFVRDAFDLREMWAEIEKQAPKIEVAVQSDMLIAINRLVERVTLWSLRNLEHPMDVEKSVQQAKPGIQEFYRSLEQVHSAFTRTHYEAAAARLKEAGVTDALAGRIASLGMLASSCDVISVAQSTGLPVPLVGATYFALGEELRLGWLREQTATMRTASHWDRLALRALVQDLYDEQRRLTAAALSAGKGIKSAEKAVEEWKLKNQATLPGYERFIEDLHARGAVEISALLVTLKHIRML